MAGPANFLDGHARAIVLLSGGLDSATALFLARREAPRCDLRALTFDAPGRSAAERRATDALARAARVPLEAVEVPFLAPLDAMRLGEAHPLARLAGPIPGAYVPGRNLVFYAIAAARAEAIGASAIVGGHVAGDEDGFPDAAPAFFRRLEALVAAGSWAAQVAPVRILTPLAGLAKSEVVRLATELAVPLAATFSCYAEGPLACGACVSCVERRDAFRAIGAEDPAAYAQSV
jgi:7-cyano-7-deazaguanine synthase